MVDLPELIPTSAVGNILTYVSHPAADLIKENLEEVESNWDFLVTMRMLKEQNVSYCVKYCRAPVLRGDGGVPARIGASAKDSTAPCVGYGGLAPPPRRCRCAWAKSAAPPRT